MSHIQKVLLYALSIMLYVSRVEARNKPSEPSRDQQRLEAAIGNWRDKITTAKNAMAEYIKDKQLLLDTAGNYTQIYNRIEANTTNLDLKKEKKGKLDTAVDSFKTAEINMEKAVADALDLGYLKDKSFGFGRRMVDKALEDFEATELERVGVTINQMIKDELTTASIAATEIVTNEVDRITIEESNYSQAVDEYNTAVETRVEVVIAEKLSAMKALLHVKRCETPRKAILEKQESELVSTKTAFTAVANQRQGVKAKQDAVEAAKQAVEDAKRATDSTALKTAEDDLNLKAKALAESKKSERLKTILYEAKKTKLQALDVEQIIIFCEASTVPEDTLLTGALGVVRRNKQLLDEANTNVETLTADLGSWPPDEVRDIETDTIALQPLYRQMLSLQQSYGVKSLDVMKAEAEVQVAASEVLTLRQSIGQ